MKRHEKKCNENKMNVRPKEQSETNIIIVQISIIISNIIPVIVIL